MKTKILFAFSLLFVFLLSQQNFYAQAVKVTRKKITYKRKNTDVDYKKSFSITYPKVSGVSANLVKKIEGNLSFEKAFDFALKDEIEKDAYLDSADFKVLYNKSGILNVELWEEVSGAYPSTYNKSIVVDVKNGGRVKAAEVFVKLPQLIATVKKLQAAEIKKGIAIIKKEAPDIENPMEFFNNTDYTIENLNDFSVTEKGVIFRYDYEFAHVAQALQPEGRFFLSWRQLKPFIKRGGAFAKFAR